MYDELVRPYGAQWAFAAVVRTVLLSPQFLYRSEIGPAGTGVVKIDDYEIASLLSFSLTDKGPDAGAARRRQGRQAARRGGPRGSTRAG